MDGLLVAEPDMLEDYAPSFDASLGAGNPPWGP